MKVVVSCCQCAMLRVCYGNEIPERNAARAKASACRIPGKGRTTDVVRVIGRDRGMSRKNAVRMMVDGKLRFLDEWTLVMP